MGHSLEGEKAYSIIEAKAREEGVTAEQFVGNQLGLAVLRSTEESDDPEEFGSGNIVLLEITGDENPAVIAHALVDTVEEAMEWATLIAREKHVPSSSTFLSFELPPVEEFDVDTGQVIFEARRDAIGQHAVFPTPTMRWVSNGRNKL
jgi:hypothetical protein